MNICLKQNTSMNIEDLKCLAAVSVQLPKHAYLTYENIEIIEINTFFSQEIELTNGVKIDYRAINEKYISIQFD